MQWRLSENTQIVYSVISGSTLQPIPQINEQLLNKEPQCLTRIGLRYLLSLFNIKLFIWITKDKES
jgi:hypothetical protein